MKMKLLVACLLMYVGGFGQVKIGENPNSVNASSLLELESTTKGLLLPRLTSTQIAVISNPPKGMLLFNITDSSLYVRRDSGWAIIPIASNANSKTLYWSLSGNNIYNSNSGNIGIGTASPTAKLHVQDSSVLFSAGLNFTISDAPNVPIAGAGRRMMWYPGKAAFRVGCVLGDHWDKNNIGAYSFASGYNTLAAGIASVALGSGSNASGWSAMAFGEGAQALGEYSISMGRNTQATKTNTFSAGYSSTATEDFAIALGTNCAASNLYATAIGYDAKASGVSSFSLGRGTRANILFSTALGYETQALDQFSTAIGNSSIAEAEFSTAIGSSTKARAPYSTALGMLVYSKGYGGTALGLYNDTTDVIASGVSNNNRIFQVGNGVSNNARSNALTILQNGNVGIGTTNPSQKVEVNGTILSSTIASTGSVRIDYSDANTGSFSNVIAFGSSTGEGIGSRRSGTANSSQNAFGIDFYTNSTNRLAISNSGNVGIGTTNPSQKLEVNGTMQASTVASTGNVTVQNGKGIIRSASSTQQKILTTTATVNNSISAGGTITVAFTWPEAFTGNPVAYVGNISGGVGGWAEVIMTIGSATTTGGVLYISNPRGVAVSPNFIINIVGIGAQ